MSGRNQRNFQSWVMPVKHLLIVSAVVCLLATLATWALGFVAMAAPQPVSTAAPESEAAVEETAVTPSPPGTPAAVAEPPPVIATSEPTADAPVPTPAAAQTRYTIREGDTLGAIARVYGVSVEDLVAVNGLDDPGTILAGQTLIVPRVHREDAKGVVGHSVSALQIL